MSTQPASATAAPPLALLAGLKRVEAELGRDARGQRWGPRPIDLDIVFYEDWRVLDGEPIKLIERALKLDPDNLKALALAGAAAWSLSDMIGSNAGIIAAVVLHEQLALYHLVGGLLTLGGVILSERWTTVLGRKTSAA